jgi:hypothetical protein
MALHPLRQMIPLRSIYHRRWSLSVMFLNTVKRCLLRRFSFSNSHYNILMKSIKPLGIGPNYFYREP